MLIIFDLDDTLIDSTGFLIEPKLQEALRAMIRAGLVVESFEDAWRMLQEINKNSNSSDMAFKTFSLKMGGIDSRILDVGFKEYDSGLGNLCVEFVPGVSEVLDFLKDTQHTLAIVTRGNASFQDQKIDYVGIDRSLFSEILIVDNYDKGDAYKQVWDSHPQEKLALVIGDKVFGDLLPGARLGMKTVYVAWGRGLAKPPSKGEVDYSIDSMEQLILIIKNLSERDVLDQ